VHDATRRRTTLSVLVALVATGVLVAVIWRRRDEFAEAVASASLGVLALATLLQLLALLVRTEAWHVCIEAAGGTLARRPLYRAAGVGYLGSQLNSQAGTAARIAALRRAAPEAAPRVPALIAAEVPIVVVEGAFGAIASFTLVGPLGLPWWVPLAMLAGAALITLALQRVSRGHGQGWRTGLAVLRTLRAGSRITALMSVAIAAQITRNWITLHAVGVDASWWDATAVLIVQAVLSQLPVGPTSGPAATVLILGSGGVVAAAAAGVLLTATGTAGALLYVAWSAADGLHARRRAARTRTRPAPEASG
jgi:uncharacterized membrane protein YbhN (UPF0104 family)